MVSSLKWDLEGGHILSYFVIFWCNWYETYSTRPTLPCCMTVTWNHSLPLWWAEALCARCPPSQWSPRVLCLGAAPPPALPPPPPPPLPSAAPGLSTCPPPSTTSSFLQKLSGRLCSPRRPWCFGVSGLHRYRFTLKDSADKTKRNIISTRVPTETYSRRFD